MLKYKIIFPQDVIFYVEEELIKYMPKIESLAKEEYVNELVKNNNRIVRVNHIEGEIFSHILSYIIHLSIYPDDKQFRENMIRNMDINTMFDVIIASNYFNVEVIVNHCTNIFKSTIEDNNPDQIKKIFNIDE